MPSRMVLAGVPAGSLASAPSAPRAAAPRRRRVIKSTFGARALSLVTSRGAGLFFAIALLGLAGAYGAVRGGHYDRFVASEGTLQDIAAKALGFDIAAVTIAGQTELAEAEILGAAGIGPKNSLVFLDVVKLRERLTSVPLIKNASVRKLYPNRLLIEIEERLPAALWQKDGAVSVVSADGTVIDEMRDQRFAELPFVVGEGANMRLDEFKKLLEGAPELRGKIRAGVLVSGRRWNLTTTNGIEIKLPESAPAAALASLAQVQRDSRVLEKDVTVIDLRQPGRLTVRLSEEAASARVEVLAKKSRLKGGQI